MTIARLAFAAAAAFCAAWPCGAAPLEAYGRLPSIEEVAVSPDGTQLAYTVTNGEVRKVVISSLDDPKAAMMINAADSKVRDLTWAGPDHLLITITRTASMLDVMSPRAELAMVADFNLKTRRLKPLLQDNGGGLNIVYGAPQVRIIDGKAYAFLKGVHFVDSEGRTSLFKVDLDRVDSKMVEVGGPDTIDILADGRGVVVAEEDFDRRSGRWTLKVKHGAGWRESRSISGGQDEPAMLGLGRDGVSVVVRDYDAHGQPQLREVALADGSWGEPFVKGDVSPIYDPATHNLIGVATSAPGAAGYRFFDPNDQKRWVASGAAYPDSLVDLRSWSADRMKIVVKVDSPALGPGYALIDLVARKGIWLGDEYQGVLPADIAPVRTVAFKAADGLPLSGYLTLPLGRGEKNLPLVVFPHGGPASRDSEGFDWWAQAMASRGYAVLQVNFRGSDGLGKDLLEAGYGQWGRKMQTDLSDGVRHLAAQGTIDPKRVCIVGASYGGYAALAGAALDPGVYRCAASVAGPADLKRFVAWSRGRSGASAQRYWTRFMGAEDLGDPVLAQISPTEHADKVTIPVLLIHGRDDTVVPLEQSLFMAESLKRAGKSVELVTQAGADHWLSLGDTRLQTLQSIVAFLEKHNPPS